MICKKCGKENTEWKSGETYKGLDEHHNPPKYMFKAECSSDCIAGYEFIEKWVGEIYWLCRDCHTGKNGLHQTIILPYLFKKSNILMRRMNRSEQWLWYKQIPNNEKKKIREEIFTISKKWVLNGNTKTTAAEGN